jgi:hypothetical protein
VAKKPRDFTTANATRKRNLELSGLRAVERIGSGAIRLGMQESVSIAD